MRRLLLTLLLAIAGLGLAGSGCILVDSDGSHGHSSSSSRSGGTAGGSDSECCSTVRVCQTRCDSYHCWDDCELQTQCASDCRTSCAGDLDCPEKEVCLDGRCVDRDWTRTGTGGLCQTCETAYDCAEPDSRCIRLYFERTPAGGPKVCATDCEKDAHCPWDFECVDRDGTGRVCVPDREWGSTDRVCDPDDLPRDKECFSARQCEAGESCVNNECVAPNGQCTRSDDCPRGQECRNFQCKPADEAECVSRTDCRSDEICVDGQCTARNPDSQCTRNSECRGEAMCVDGECLARCSDRSDCNASSEICRQGLCQPIECRFNGDCGRGEVCVDAQCQTACLDEGDCPSGYRCSDSGGYCERDPDVECRSDAECLSGEACHQDTCSQICNCNQQCPGGQVCNQDATAASNTGLCESPEREDEKPARECRTACDCPSGQSCEAGKCKESP